MKEERLVDGYYQSNIKTSRNEDSVYAMKYASQQILIDKLEEENKSLQSQLKEKEEENKQLKADYGTQVQIERDMLQQENQELKLELSGYRQAILEDKDMLGLKEESEELKKQLTTYKILHRDCKVDNLKNISKIEEMENQQKEFIEYLEYQVKHQEELNDIHLTTGFEEILSKFKEIIGGKYE